MQGLTVSALVAYLKAKLDTDQNIQKVMVCGEISNFHHHYSGHLYFTLKDEKAQIACVMFKSSAQTLKFEPKTGDKVILVANTSIFESSGALQLYVQKMTLDGLGDLYSQYEALKNKLSSEGYFDEEHKIELSKKYLDKVAVLVGDKSAAMSDIKIIFSRRWPLTKVDFYPVLVQGDSAPSSIINELNKVDKLDYDAIVLARGGGSFEDLFCFNDEQLVKTIYSLKTFIITGIGHEQDFTLADFVADKRAATPTAAIELITPNIIDVIDTIESYEYSLKDEINTKVNELSLKYDYLLERLLHFQKNLLNISNSLDYKTNQIKTNILNKIKINLNILDNIESNLYSRVKYSLNNKQLLLKRLNTLLEAYSSQNVLKRGYTMVKQNDVVIKSKKNLNNDAFEVKFYDGSIFAYERK